MLVPKYFIVAALLVLTGCAGKSVTGPHDSPTEYVEISNPALTMSRDAPATIWVPKGSVEKGPPRGGEAVKMAYKSVMGAPTAAHAPQTELSAPTVQSVQSAPSQPNPVGMRNRAVVVEAGQNQLAIPFRETLRVLPNAPVIAVAPEMGAEKLLSRDERAAYAVKAWQDSGLAVVVFISAPEGLASGRHLSAELYDGLGAGLFGMVDSIIPTYDAHDPAGYAASVASAVSILAERARDAALQLPWYARIVAVEADKVYLNAGHEAGINLGQRLQVLRGGKLVKGLGFAPGNVVGTVEVRGFVGPNGAVAAVKGDLHVYQTDILAAQ